MHLILHALAAQGWGKRNLIALLRGELALGERARAASSFGKLSFRSENALSKLIDQLITRELVAETLLTHGGIALGLTKAGRQLLNSAQPVGTPPPAR